MQWPTRTPDLNPIGHLGDHLKPKVQFHDAAPTMFHELKDAVIEEWDTIPQEEIYKLLRSMCDRMEAVIRAFNTRF
ncbi:unnamed protein product [Euphydryas editha]|uniref:Tc1-like transposase DDE domain-containing protein n=1 Tax=Euphydryas editha TaxID=104508 RepID=A0AAU9UP98_EUPED|nr:unnamed protein product [Euphydryas editha]